MKSAPSPVIFACCFLGLLISYLMVGYSRQLPSGDEIVSVLSAAGNQQTYEEVITYLQQYRKVVPVSDWQKLLQPHAHSLHHISPDLGNLDIHPPLYFWLLHFTLYVFATPLTGALVLNALLHIVAAIGLYLLARALSISQRAFSVILIYWMFSPAIMGTGFYARQYELLCCAGIYSSLAYWYYLKEQKAGYLVLFFATVLAGMLTQYLFIFHSLVYVAYSVFIRKHTGQSVVIAALCGAAFFCVTRIHLGIWDQFHEQSTRVNGFHLTELPARIGKIVVCFVQVWFPVFSFKMWLMKLPQWVPAVLLLGTAIPGIWLLKKMQWKQAIQHMVPKSQQPAFEHWMLLFSLGIICGPYLLFKTTFHSMASQYLMLVYPFFLLVLIPVLEKSKPIMNLLTGILIGGWALHLLAYQIKQKQLSPLVNDAKKADLIVLTSRDRRGFLRLLPYLPSSQKVLFDEEATPCTYASLGNIFFISGKPIKELNMELLNQYKEYDLTDGLSFYTCRIDSMICKGNN